MAVRSYRPKRDDTVVVGQQILEDHARDIAHEQLLPRIEEINKIAIDTVRIEVYLYTKLKAGRRCSCWLLESSPSTQCSACFGTGIPGGYEKYGTHLHIIDVTHPNIRSANIIPDFLTKTKPFHFVLIPGAKNGFIEVTVPLQTNIGVLDSLQVLSDLPSGSEMYAYLKAPSDSDYVAFTSANFEQRLYNAEVDVRIEFTRSSIYADSPRLATVYMRYQRLANISVKANIPRVESSSLLSDMGVADDWTHQKFFFDSTIRSLTTEDFVSHVNNQTRWKIDSVSPMAPEDHLLSWDVDTRLVQTYDVYAKVPL